VNSREYLTSFREEDGDEKNAQVIYLSDRYLSEKHDYSVPQPENHVIENENSKVITEALGKLSKKYAEVVILREIVGMSHAEIATKLGISESASKVRTHRAMKKLRDLLVEQGDL
jgi:RNA polymerase sigma factor (sigma-70 family)